MAGATDSLTQLQDSLDTMLTMMYAHLKYIQDKAPYGEIEGQPSQAPQGPSTNANANTNGDSHAANGESAAQSSQNAKEPSTPVPDPPDKFNAELEERARDLVLGYHQMEIIIKSLPGVDNSEADQEKRMRELEQELRQVELERLRKESEKQAMVDLLGEAIVKIKRVP